MKEKERKKESNKEFGGDEEDESCRKESEKFATMEISLSIERTSVFVPELKAFSAPSSSHPRKSFHNTSMHEDGRRDKHHHKKQLEAGLS